MAITIFAQHLNICSPSSGEILNFFTGDCGVGEGSWFQIGDRLILLCFLAWLDRSRSIARSTVLGVASSFFWGFVIVHNELKNDFMERPELDFGGIDCEFGGLSPLASTTV